VRGGRGGSEEKGERARLEGLGGDRGKEGLIRGGWGAGRRATGKGKGRQGWKWEEKCWDRKWG